MRGCRASITRPSLRSWLGLSFDGLILLDGLVWAVYYGLGWLKPIWVDAAGWSDWAGAMYRSLCWAF